MSLPEMTLAEKFGVNRPYRQKHHCRTLREGILESMQGRGTMIARK